MTHYASQNKKSRQKLAIVFKEFELPPEAADWVVEDITLDSRKVIKGSVFFALKGSQLNREMFIDAAIELGARVVVKQGDEDGVDARSDAELLVLTVRDLKSRIGIFAARFFNYPSQSLTVIGITGTNGKTSCAELMKQAWHALGYTAASVGTLGLSFSNGEHLHTGLTTLDAIENQRVLQMCVDREVSHVAMEVSSHGIDQGRVTGVDFSAKVLTNISQDHLDYHKTMSAYAAVKTDFVFDGASSVSVCNIDDDETNRYLSHANTRSVKGACLTSVKSRQADVFCENVVYSPNGTYADIETPRGRLKVSVSLLGEFNLKNMLSLVAVLVSLSDDQALPIKSIEAALSRLKPVSGRMELVTGSDSIYIDYAHTPDALENVLQALKLHCENKLILVFGCGGDRDQGKRPLMGRVAEKHAQVVYLTTDNPRSESPESIAENVLEGISKPEAIIVELDRKKAIAKAVSIKQPGDIVLIAGKGHETYQEIKGTKTPFSDYEEVRRLIA